MGFEWDKVEFRAQTEVKHGRVSSEQTDYCMYHTAGISWAKLRWVRLIWIERLDFAERRDFSINLCSYRVREMQACRTEVQSGWGSSASYSPQIEV